MVRGFSDGLTMVVIDFVKTKSSSKDFIVQMIEEDENGNDQGETFFYKYCYLAVVILDLMFQVIEVLWLVVSYYYLWNEQLRWLPIIVITMSLSIHTIYQFHGWQGYFHHDAASVKIFAIYRSVMAIFPFAPLLGLIRVLYPIHHLLLQLLCFTLGLVMAYVPFKFASCVGKCKKMVHVENN